ncbi:MAG TPA: peptidylprolyl isomerase, partial [Acidimicrobiales bacterium]|nr:peptidylprolyl isomerase [Acidimicrobiales bacterium]
MTREEASMERESLGADGPRWRSVATAVAVVVVVAIAGAVGFTVARDLSAPDETSDLANVRTPDQDGPAGLEIRPVEPGLTINGETPCPAADGTAPRTTQFEQPPPMCIDASRSYVATVSTTKGSFRITLDPGRAPRTVNNFVVLARYHFYEGIAFHRIIPGFVVQAGDPMGNGRGGPGYTVPDELPGPGEYEAGSVAMANSGPDTNGSQFFVVTGPAGVSLPPSYSLFG